MDWNDQAESLLNDGIEQLYAPNKYKPYKYKCTYCYQKHDGKHECEPKFKGRCAICMEWMTGDEIHRYDECVSIRKHRLESEVRKFKTLQGEFKSFKQELASTPFGRDLLRDTEKRKPENVPYNRFEAEAGLIEPFFHDGEMLWRKVKDIEILTPSAPIKKSGFFGDGESLFRFFWSPGYNLIMAVIQAVLAVIAGMTGSGWVWLHVGVALLCSFNFVTGMVTREQEYRNELMKRSMA